MHPSRWLKTAHGHWPHVNVCIVSCGGVVNMLLVISITSYFHYNIWGCMCSTGPFQYRWLKGYIYSSCYSSSNRKYPPFPLLSYFPWLCVWDICYIILCYLLHIHSGKTGNLFSLLLCSLWWVQIIGYVLSWRSYSFVCTLHHPIIIIYANLSEDIEYSHLNIFKLISTKKNRNRNFHL